MKIICVNQVWLYTVLVAFLFLAVHPVRAVASEQLVQNRVTPKRRALPNIQKNFTRTYYACEQALTNNILIPVTQGDIEITCQCVNNAFKATDLSEEYKSNFFTSVGGKEYLFYEKIHVLSRASLVPKQINLSAEDLAGEVTRCFEPIPTHGDLFFGYKKEVANKKPETAAVIPGPARSAHRGFNGIAQMRLESVNSALNMISLQKNIDDRQALAFKRALSSDVLKTPILTCAYRIEERHLVSPLYAYWYKEEPSTYTNTMKESLPENHPIFEIGAPREWCPERRP